MFHKDADMSRYLSHDFFKDFQIEINNDACIECDYWVIFGGLYHKKEVVQVDPKNIFLIAVEFDGGYNQNFLNQFAKVLTVDTKLRGDNLVYYHLGLPWFINQSFDDLYKQTKVEKQKLLSIVVSSNKQITYSRNYKLRYDFALAAKKYFGDRIDVFGRGFKEIKNKDEGLYPYKFSIAIENMPIHYWITEKIHDCFLTHTFPFYHGSGNINRFFSTDSYSEIDILDIDYSLARIDEIITTPNFYEDHLEALIIAKKEYLLHYSFISVMIDIIEKFGNATPQKSRVEVKADNSFKSRLKLKIIDLSFNLLR